MRLRWTLALAPILLFGSGCFVFDEIDKGMKIMEAHSPNRNKKKQEEEAKDSEKSPTYRETVHAWWKDAKTLSISPGDRKASDDPMVLCNHRGKTVFTKKSDCIARGGQPG